jgi:cation transport regulator ChaC
VELHALEIEGAMAHPHDEAVRPGGHFKLARQALIEHYERVVTADDEWVRDTSEDAGVIVGHEAGSTVQQLWRHDDVATEGLCYRLMTETDTEKRHLVLCAVVHELKAVARTSGVTWPRRDQDPLDPERAHVTRGDVIVSPHDDLRAELAEILDEVVDEGVVVVDDKDGGFVGHCSSCYGADSVTFRYGAPPTRPFSRPRRRRL